MPIREAEDALFEEWRAARERFVPDGLADEAAYLASSPRILFVMKETNGFDEGDLRELLRDGDRSQTWTNITRWLLGIRALPGDILWSDLAAVDAQRRREMLRSVGAMNIKKSTGHHTSINADLWSIAREDKAFLRRQYALYDPDLTICCGSVTSDAFRQIVLGDLSVDCKHTSRGIGFYWRAPGRAVVDFSHPEARVQDSLLHYGLVDAIREIRAPQKADALTSGCGGPEARVARPGH